MRWTLSFLCKNLIQYSSVHFKFDGKVMLYCGHDTRDELEEEEKTIFTAGFAAIALNLFDHFLHHSGVVAWMNAKLVHR